MPLSPSRLLLPAFLLVATAMAMIGSAQAQSRIGVTQSTENSPVGKPPGAADRILRVGTDIQANETVSTNATDRAHLVFLDGTTVTIGPNSRLVIDKFVYDPATQKGELALNTATGVFRVIGGRISKTSEIKVTTPSSTLGIRGGIMVFGVTPSATTSILVYGDSMSVTSGGVTRTVQVPGLSVSANLGGAPGAPTVAVQGDLAAALANLVSNTSAPAATLAAIQTLVADNVGSPVTLAAVLNAIIAANVPVANTTSQITLDVSVNSSAQQCASCN